MNLYQYGFIDSFVLVILNMVILVIHI